MTITEFLWKSESNGKTKKEINQNRKANYPLMFGIGYVWKLSQTFKQNTQWVQQGSYYCCNPGELLVQITVEFQFFFLVLKAINYLVLFIRKLKFDISSYEKLGLLEHYYLKMAEKMYFLKWDHYFYSTIK